MRQLATVEWLADVDAGGRRDRRHRLRPVARDDCDPHALRPEELDSLTRVRAPT